MGVRTETLTRPAERGAELETLSACPLCACPEVAERFDARDRMLGRSNAAFGYARCARCDVWFQSPRPTERSLAEYYPSDYEPYQEASMSGVRGAGDVLAVPFELWNKLVKAIFPERWRKMRKRTYEPPRPGARMLDYGCGSPRTLDAARARGWTTIGADFAAAQVALVREAGHEAYVAGDELWNSVPDGSLDLVRLNHVIEHLYDPKSVLTRLRAKLRPGGVIHLAMPNTRSVSFRWFRSRWWGLDCPRHAILYDAKRLQSLLEQCGFVGVKSCDETTTTYFLRSATYVLIDMGRTTRDALATAATSRFWNALTYTPARVATACRWAARVHLLARAP